MKKQIFLLLSAGSVQICCGQAAPPKPCTPAAINGGFEQPVVSNCWNDFNAVAVPGWNTTANDNKIEMWDAACMGVPAYMGSQFAELNANMVSSLYEEICTPCPNVVNWSFAHRGRLGTDVCALKAGPSGGPYTTIYSASDGNTAWGLHSGTYTVPPGQTVTRFLFESVSAAGGNSTYGNFLDAVNFTFSGLNLSTSQTNITCGNNAGSATVTVNGGAAPYTYTWSPSGGSSASATGLSAGTYTVVVADAGGCSSQAVFNITSTSGFTASTTQSNVSCFGLNNGSAGVTITGGVQPYTYAWSTNPVQTSPNLSNLPAGNYSCVITDASGCTVVQNVTVSQPPPMNVSITSLPASCSLNDGSAGVTAAGGASPYSYMWLTNPVQTGSSVSNLVPGNYSVIVSDANGCTQMQNTVITGGISPLANFTFDPETLLITDPSVNFTDLSNSAFTWTWNFGDGNTAVQQHPTHTYSDTGIYCITLVVTDPSSACIDSITKCLKVIDQEWTFYVPNAFTPNADGTNDLFFGIGLGISDYEMFIFDRWGNKIWQCSSDGLPQESASCKWDGKVEKGSSGEPSQEDVYVWKADFTDILGKQHHYVGHVSLVK